MKKKILKLAAVSALILILSATAGMAQEAFDQYGFGDRAFLVQSALESGKSAKGFWDIPGTPGKTNGNFTDNRKVKKFLEMQIWDRQKGDPDDRVYTFGAGVGSQAGKYSIGFARQRHWGVNYIEGTGKIEVRFIKDSFEIKHMGGDKWKIYVKPGYVLCLEKNTSKNGTKLTAKPDHNGKDALWVFYDLATLRSFIPARIIKPEPVSAIPDFFIKNQKFEYSAEGNFFYYKAKGTAEVTKIEGDVAYVTVNISESESEGEKGRGIVKKGKSTFEAKFTRKGDTYFIDKEKNGDMASSGKVDPSGLYLRLTNDGGGKTFKAVK